jgi:DNA repair exonuclease SbcCD ATPase subunit
MILKVIKYGVLTLAGGALVTSLLLGTEAFSYARSSARSVRMAVKDNIPIEFELRRARDLLDDILPEMQANVRLMAQQEVEIDAAKEDIDGCQKSLADEGVRVQKLRDMVSTGPSTQLLGEITYTRDQLKHELARRFERYREAESALSAKKKLLEERRRSLSAAEQQFEQMRVRKVALESQVQALSGQYRLVQAASNKNGVRIDPSRLAEAERLVGQIRQQLNVAEHVLAREAKFTQPIVIDVIDDQDLVARVDRHFKPSDQAAKQAPVAPTAPAAPSELDKASDASVAAK